MISFFKNFRKERVGIRGRITLRAYRAGTKELLQEIVTDNLIMQGANTGKDLIVQWLLGVTTYPVGINWGAIGTGSTTPAVSDTQLATETNRSSVTYYQDSGYNEAVLQFFFSDSALVNGTYREFGSFVNGSSSANSGQLFNRALFSSPYVKSSGVDTTVEVCFGSA